MSDVIGMRELEKRLAEATWPDKSISRDIQCTIGGWYRRSPSEGKTRHPTFIHPDDCRDGKPVYDQLHGTDIWREPPDVIASLDAAVSLCERLGYQWHVSGMKAARVCKDGKHTIVDYCPTPALALCLALVRAVTDKGEGK